MRDSHGFLFVSQLGVRAFVQRKEAETLAYRPRSSSDIDAIREQLESQPGRRRRRRRREQGDEGEGEQVSVPCCGCTRGRTVTFVCLSIVKRIFDGTTRFPKIEECAHFHYDDVDLGKDFKVGVTRDVERRPRRSDLRSARTVLISRCVNVRVHVG